jgi:2-polyprenyl-3-methyl-5-hydroxy-6-metoxy-1,4-benzoquinol methylase
MDKKAYFDKYWTEMNIEVADLRTAERVNSVLRLLTKKTGRLLDVGCGRGISCQTFSKLGFEVKGFDISPEVVEIAKRRGVNAYLFDMEAAALEGKYDVIICLEVLQFLVDPLKALKNLRSALKEDGEIIISFPNEFHIWRRIKVLFGHYDFAKYDAPHVRLFHPKEIHRLMQEAGMKIERKAFIPLLPPRLQRFFALFWTNKILSKISPSLFALSVIFDLKIRDDPKKS